MSVDLTALKAELLTDPAGLGYVVNDNAGNRDKLNLVRAAIQIDVDSVSPAEIMRATVFAELATAEQQRKYLALTQASVDPNASNIVGAFANVFPAGPTRTALLLLQTRDGSRAEQLFGRAVSTSQVAEALRTT